MSCTGEGATHHAACDCREAAHRAEVERLETHVKALEAALQGMVDVTYGSLYEPLARARDKAQVVLMAGNAS